MQVFRRRVWPARGQVRRATVPKCAVCHRNSTKFRSVPSLAENERQQAASAKGLAFEIGFDRGNGRKSVDLNAVPHDAHSHLGPRTDGFARSIDLDDVLCLQARDPAGVSKSVSLLIDTALSIAFLHSDRQER